VCHIRERERRHTELVIGAQHAMELPAISQDDEHLSWGRRKNKKKRGWEMHMTEHGEWGLGQTYCPRSLLESRML
jgi:hypothetical protein